MTSIIHYRISDPMKAYTLIYALLFFLTIPGQAQWQWSHPLPQGNALYCIGFIDSVNGLAMGEYGAIVKTSDGGESWRLVDNSYKCNLFKFHFPTANVGYAIGEDKYIGPAPPLRVIMKTTDGGNHWFTVFHGVTSPFNSLWFTSELTGYTVGYLGIIRKTTDGGITWKDCSTPITDELSDIAFFDSTTGIAIGSNDIILRTGNGGKTWIRIPGVPSAEITSLRITSPHSAHMVLVGGEQPGGVIWNTVNLFRSNDKGITWQVSPDSLKLKMFNAVLSADFPDPDSGFVSIEFDKIVRTTDGGANWDTVALDFSPDYLHFMNGTTGFSLHGVKFVYSGSIGSQIGKTSDRGMNWHPTTEQSSIEYLFDIEFPSADVGYAIGGKNSYVDFLKTSDGGAHWSQPMNEVLDDSYLTASFFLNKDTGYVADGNGKLFKTTNGGVTWSNLLTSETFIATSIFFRNAAIGYVIAFETKESKSGYTVKSTTNGGIFWETVALAGTNYYTHIVFPSHDTGYLIGENTGTNPESSFYRSTDKGVHWEKITVLQYMRFASLQFFNASFGYALSAYGFLYKTLDGGDHWIVDTIEGIRSELYGMKFLNPDTGYIVGDFGLILRTTDGGNSWSKQESGTDIRLRSVCFASPGKVFAAGDAGVILAGDNMPGLGINELMPKKAGLASRYFPNPTRDNLSVSFELPVSGNVMIKVYDTWGRLVHCYSCKEMSAGRHVIPLTMASLAPGLYYCSILSDGICETRKVIVRE